MKKSLSILAILAVAPIAFVIAQTSQCLDTHQYCDYGDKAWQFNSQSVGGALEVGEPQLMSVMVYQNKDYRLSFCSSNRDVNGKIQWAIYSAENVKVYDERKKREVWKKKKVLIVDSETASEGMEAEGGLMQSIDFTSTETRRLYLEVTVPTDALEGSKRGRMQTSDWVCVGVLVQHMKSIAPEIGFGGRDENLEEFDEWED